MFEAHYPGLSPIEAYGNGGFRFAQMSHVGSLLIVPSGIYAWPVANFAEVGAGSLERVLAEAAQIDVLLLGTGVRQQFPARGLRDVLAGAGLGLEFMDTGAACRTYNVLLAEERAVAAALIAVD